MTPEHLVFYDGECGFCDGTVQFLLKRDRDEQLYFAPLQGDLAGLLLPQHNLPEDLDSIVYLHTVSDQGSVYIHSDAIANIVAVLPWPWSWCRWISIVPRIFRDWGYQQFAKRRIRWFGTVESCTLPTEAQAKRLLY